MSKNQRQKPQISKKDAPSLKSKLQPKRMVFSSPESITGESCSSQENIKKTNKKTNTQRISQTISKGPTP